MFCLLQVVMWNCKMTFGCPYMEHKTNNIEEISGNSKQTTVTYILIFIGRVLIYHIVQILCSGCLTETAMTDQVKDKPKCKLQ